MVFHEQLGYVSGHFCKRMAPHEAQLFRSSLYVYSGSIGCPLPDLYTHMCQIVIHSIMFVNGNWPSTLLIRRRHRKCMHETRTSNPMQGNIVLLDCSLTISTLLQLAVMAFVASTVFFRSKLHHETWSDGMLYMGALFFSCIVIMFNGFGELVMIIGRLPVFYKQRDLLFFPAWTFSLSNFILGIPLSVANATIWTCVTYYLTGYAKEPSRSGSQVSHF